MRNPQGHFTFDAYLYKALFAIAGEYGMSVSDFVSSILTTVVKSEIVALNVKVDKLLGKDFEDFLQREMQKIPKNIRHACPYISETEESQLAFKNYIYSLAGGTFPDGYVQPVPTPRVQQQEVKTATVSPVPQPVQPVVQQEPVKQFTNTAPVSSEDDFVVLPPDVPTKQTSQVSTSPTEQKKPTRKKFGKL